MSGFEKSPHAPTKQTHDILIVLLSLFLRKLLIGHNEGVGHSSNKNRRNKDWYLDYHGYKRPKISRQFSNVFIHSPLLFEPHKSKILTRTAQGKSKIIALSSQWLGKSRSLQAGDKK